MIKPSAVRRSELTAAITFSSQVARKLACSILLNEYVSSMDATLLNSQKQQVFDIIQAFEVDPHQFELCDTISRLLTNDKVSMIWLKAKHQFFFLFDFSGGSYFPECSPWQGVRQASFQERSWNDCLPLVGEWSSLVEAELNTPDPWRALPGVASKSDIVVAPNSTNSEFSHRETERLEKGLEEIRELILKAVGNQKKESALVNAEIKKLIEASKKMGRRDWVNQAIGALITLSITVALPPEVTRQAFEILKHALTGLVQLMPQVLASGSQLM